MMNRDILIVIGSLNRGGAETHLSQILPELVRNDLSVVVHPISDLGELSEVMKSKGVNVIKPWICAKSSNIFFKVLKLVLNSFQLFFYLLIKRPRVVHFYLPQAYLIGGLLSLISCSSVRVMSRRSLNLYLNKYPKIIRKVEFWLHTKMHHILGNSQKIIDQLEQEEGVPDAKTHLIYNGIAIERNHDIDPYRDFGIPQGSIIMIMVANLIPYKGHADLIEALSLLEVNLRWDMLFVGNDSHGILRDLKSLARRKNIEERIHFLGKRNDVVDVLSVADIGILSSHEEGFSNAILEGMGVGLPMVVTDVGGNKEAVYDKECGLIVPPKAPKEMAEALKLLIQNRELRVQYGMSARARFLENFQLKTCVKEYFDFYQKIIASKD